MSKVTLTHRPTRDPRDEQPARSEFDSVPAALAHDFELSRGRGFHVGVEIGKDGQSIYDENALSKAVSRISALVNDGVKVTDAAEQIAKEDGYLD